MRLRTRIVDAMTEKMDMHLPEARASVWGAMPPVVMFEQLAFKSTGGVVKDGGADFQLIADISGFVRVELRGDEVDRLAIEPMIASLVEGNLIFRFQHVEFRAVSERARMRLLELRDTVRETQVVTALRFAIEGELARRAEAAPRPDMLVSRVPNVGPDHIADYRPLREGLE